jgi:myo-inositol-1(or 4)-monophosphatase
VARTAAERAAAFIRDVERPANPESWSRKAHHDYVTSVDRNAEEIISDILLRAEPGSIMVGEELSPDLRQADLSWVVDPLDGTTNYLHGYPQYAVSIAALVHGTLAAGVITDVDRRVTYHAVAGGGAWRDDRRLETSRIADPAMGLFGTGFPFRTPEQIPRYLRQFTEIMRTTSGMRRAGAAALDLADVACGRLEGFWELYLAPWDVAAGTLLIREAGGTVTNLEGSPDVVAHGSIVAGGALHGWLLDRVRNA